MPQAGATMMNEGHDEHGMGDMGAPFDAMFIDGMIEHHQGAITMAEEVLATSERPELLTLADAIIAAQTTEIEQMQSWREAWYPDLAATMGMEMDMGDMSISADESIPFDQRFLQAMISHHEGALHMAEAALASAEHEEIRTLAENIIATQTAEIEQMRGWLEEWFGVTE
jgi:uncharacterized protein (DUF305 family)